MRPSKFTPFFLGLWLALVVPSLALAQATPVQAPANVPESAEKPAKPPVLVPPKLLHFEEAVFPAAALEQGLSGRVELQLVVAADGTVSEAKVVTPVGHGFDEAALTAAQKLTFSPATRDGEPVPARIVFPYVFELRAPEPAPEEPAAPLPVRLEGVVRSAEDDQPLAGVEVLVSSIERELSLRAVTDAEGKFGFDDLFAGQFRVTLNLVEWQSLEAEETLAEGEATSVVYRMQPVIDPEAFRAVARVPPPPREVTRRTIGKEELTRIPGTRGDALRAIELLPGVARPPFGAGFLIVRGSAPNDTQVLLEGIPVPLLYHFGGLTSFINSRLLESVDFYPGNFSTRYGRRRGGIVEVNLADPARDRLHGVADLNFIDGSVLLQAPITDDWEFAIAGRRSWIDFVFEQVLDDDDISTVAAPVYYDYQALTTYRPNDKNKLRLLVYGSGDRLELLFAQPSDADAAITGDFGFQTQFHRAQASWSSKVSDRVDHDLELAVGTYSVDFGIGEAFDFSLSGVDVYLRSEWRARLTDRVRLIAGLDTAFLPGKVTYKGPPIQQDENNPDANASGTTISNRERVAAVDEFNVVQPAVYFESDFNLAPMRVILGTRLDYYSEIGEFSFDPRVTGIYSLDDDTRLKAGVGMFSQPPQFQESSAAFGNSKLGPTHTVHTSTGVERDFADKAINVGVEGFYKYLYDRVIGTEFGQTPFLMNGGEGRIYGLELSAKVQPRGRFFGYLSYTLSRSERMDRNEGWTLFDFDQPHILTVSGVYRLGRGWEVGGTFRLVSGNPDTPIVAAVYNKDTGQYSPVFGPVNSIRSNFFQRLDVRVEKLWTFTDWKLAAYLDIQNVYNAANVEGYAYDFEYRTRQKITGLPFLPNLGLRGEL